MNLLCAPRLQHLFTYSIRTQRPIPEAVVCYSLLTIPQVFSNKLCKTQICHNKKTPETLIYIPSVVLRGGSVGSCLRVQLLVLPLGCFTCSTNSSLMLELNPARVLRRDRRIVPRFGQEQFPSKGSKRQSKPHRLSEQGAALGKPYGKSASSGPSPCKCCSSLPPRRRKSV